MQSGGIVTLGNPESVGAPYPIVTVRPPEDWQPWNGLSAGAWIPG